MTDVTRAALQAARACIQIDRTTWFDSNVNQETGRLDAEEQVQLDHYDGVLKLIDQALALPTGLTFDAFRQANVTRCLRWHPEGIESWSPSDWMVAIMGELGEAASLIKMRNRERDGLPGNKFSPTDKMVADELADVLTYLDLFAAVHGIDLGAAAVAKFNEVSERVGFPDRIVLAAAAQEQTA